MHPKSLFAKILLLVVSLFCAGNAHAQLLKKIQQGAKGVQNLAREVENSARQLDNVSRGVNTTPNLPRKSTPYEEGYNRGATGNDGYHKGPTGVWVKDEEPGTPNPLKRYRYDYFFMDYTDYYWDNTAYIENDAIPKRDDYETQLYADRCQKNVLKPNKDEKVFLTKMLAFFATNSRVNKKYYYCADENVRYVVNSRDAANLPTSVTADYQYSDDKGNRLNEIRHIKVEFVNGIPFLITYPNERGWSVQGNDVGAVGRLNYTKDQIREMDVARSKFAKKESDYWKKYVAPRINDSITKVVRSKFPGADCSACLVHEKDGDADVKQEIYTTTDEYGNTSETRRNTATTSHYKLVNKCNKNIKVIGVEISSGDYYIQSREYRAKQVIYLSTTSQSNLEDAFNHFGDNILFGSDDIDLDRINKQYDVEKGPSIQWLRIVEDK